MAGSAEPSAPTATPGSDRVAIKDSPEVPATQSSSSREMRKKWACDNFPVWRSDLVCIGSF